MERQHHNQGGGVNGLGRTRILWNVDPEVVEFCCASYIACSGVTFLTTTQPENVLSGLITAPVLTGLILIFGREMLSLIGGLMMVLCAIHWGAVAEDRILARRIALALELGWFSYVAIEDWYWLGIDIRSLLYTIFILKSLWALLRLFRAGIRHND